MRKFTVKSSIAWNKKMFTTVFSIEEGDHDAVDAGRSKTGRPTMKPTGSIFEIHIPLREQRSEGPVLARKPAPLFVVQRRSFAQRDTGKEGAEGELPPAA
jgi:hypothetical protein